MKAVETISKRLRNPQSGTAKAPRLMRCVVGFASNNPMPISSKVGARYPEDHELVRRAPWAFIPDDQPDYVGDDVRRQYELRETMKGQAIADETERRGRPRETPRKDPVIPLELQRLCIRSCGAFGSSAPISNKDAEPSRIQIGDIASANWKLVKKYPERFVRVLPEGLDIADALVCIADEHITEMTQAGEIGRRVYRGQMVHRDDPLVEIHGSMFAPLQLGLAPASRQVVVIAGKENVITDSGRLVGREAADGPGYGRV